jgi:hypothetical protein
VSCHVVESAINNEMASSPVDSLCSAYCSSVRMTQFERLLSAEPVVMILSHTLAVAAGRMGSAAGPNIRYHYIILDRSDQDGRPQVLVPYCFQVGVIHLLDTIFFASLDCDELEVNH